MSTDSTSPTRRSWSWRTALPATAAIVAVALGLGWLLSRQAALFEELREIDLAWAAVDRAITQRAERAARLVETVEGGGRAREALRGLDAAVLASERIEANRVLDEAIAELPDSNLSDPKEIERLRDRLEAAELEISSRRREYNDAVQAYNTRIQLFPDNFVAWIGGLERVEEYVR